MPKLIDVRKVKKVELPSFKGSEVELYDDLLAGDIQEIQNAKDDMERAFIGLVKVIKDWNFTDDNGNKLPITVENLKKLPIKDITFLIENSFGGDLEKKTLTA